MNADEPRAAFTARPRRSAAGGDRPHSTRKGFDDANLLAELDALLARIDRVRSTPVDGFSDGTPAYDAACMVVIRLAALLEREDYSSAFGAVVEEEKRAIRTTRNIAAHAGYRSMNDELLYLAVTRRLPEIIARVRTRLEGV